jgi:RsiW-degrading membrane proteinase PrsW (M82 family)
MSATPFQVVMLSTIFSLLPILAWATFLLYKHNEKRNLVVNTFMLGALMVVPLLVYKHLWNYVPILNFKEAFGSMQSTVLSLIFLFLTVGIIEEFLKHFVAGRVEHKEINSIDDAIEFSIMAALGFSFAENTIYFIQVWQNMGQEVLWQLVGFRSLFSTFAHVLFSTIYGYHFGLALFATPVYKDMSKKRFDKRFINFLHKFTKIKSSALFHEQQIFAGLFYASVLHAIFNTTLELGYTKFLVPFLIFGLMHVMSLILDRHNQVEYASVDL